MVIAPEVLKPYEFDAEVSDIIIGGQSAIDSARGLRVRSSEEAQKFLEGYGYDQENPIEKAELFGNFQEALSFIRRYFLHPHNPDGLKIEIPRKIAEIIDISQLLLYVSPAAGVLQPGTSQHALMATWACAILKVMHTVAHIDKDLRTPYFLDIQTQILDRFYKFIFSDEGGQVYLGRGPRDPNRVDLISFESKPRKTRDSMIIKLLHKPENVAEDIFDRVGVRFVTKNKLDVVRVIKFIKDRYVIMPANLKPSRSRNTLIDMKKFQGELKRVLDEVAEGVVPPADLYRTLVDATEGATLPIESSAPTGASNPYSSQHYRSVQFTCRQLIKIRNALYDDLKALRRAIKDEGASETVGKIAARLDLSTLQKESRFFYPFEVQVVDERSHVENLAGQSSHSNYKKSQIQAAMRRVMGEIMRSSERAFVVQDQGSSSKHAAD